MADDNPYRGIGHLGEVLILIFVVLKLVGTIDWSWWWVLSPMWIYIILAGVILLAHSIASGDGYRGPMS